MNFKPSSVYLNPQIQPAVLLQSYTLPCRVQREVVQDEHNVINIMLVLSFSYRVFLMNSVWMGLYWKVCTNTGNVRKTVNPGMNWIEWK